MSNMHDARERTKDNDSSLQRKVIGLGSNYFLFCPTLFTNLAELYKENTFAIKYIGNRLSCRKNSHDERLLNELYSFF